MQDRPLTLADVLPALLIGAATLSLLAGAQLAPRPGRPALALFPPWVRPARAFALAAATPGWRPLALARTVLGSAVTLIPIRRTRLGHPAEALLLDRAGAAGCLVPRPQDRE